MQEALSAWTIANRPHHIVYRVVGAQWAPRSHQVRELLSRNGVPFAFSPVDSSEGQQLLRDYSVDPRRLPALIRNDGTVLHDPSFPEIADAHGIQVQPPDEIYDLAILGAGPAGLAAAVYGSSEGLRTMVIESWPSVARPAPAHSSATISGPRGLSGSDLAHRDGQQRFMARATLSL